MHTYYSGGQPDSDSHIMWSTIMQNPPRACWLSSLYMMYTYTVLCSNVMVLCSGPSGYSDVLDICSNHKNANYVIAHDDVTCHARVRVCLTCTISSFATHKVVSFPSPNPRVGKGLVTLEPFLGSTGAWLNHNVMQSITCPLQVAAQWDAKS